MCISPRQCWLRGFSLERRSNKMLHPLCIDRNKCCHYCAWNTVTTLRSTRTPQWHKRLPSATIAGAKHSKIVAATSIETHALLTNHFARKIDCSLNPYGVFTEFPMLKLAIRWYSLYIIH